MQILVSGSEGLVGRRLCAFLQRTGHRVVTLDNRLAADRAGHGDIRDQSAVARSVTGCDGVIHLAGVSRVLWGEREPDVCWDSNVGGTQNIVDAAIASSKRAWVLFASSREVYGEPVRLPVSDDDPIRPINIYGRSKAQAESILIAARDRGIRTGVVRLSNVYGDVRDWPDRVSPAFARGAAQGSPLKVCGSGHTFDFTHVEDTVRGIALAAEALGAGESKLPPMHFLTGQATTLGELAALANEAGGGRSTVVEAPQRSYDVAHFVGDPRRADEILGWRAAISVQVGIPRFVRDFAATLREAQSDQAAE